MYYSVMGEQSKKDIISNMRKQIIEMQNQINIQASKINLIFSMVGI